MSFVLLGAEEGQPYQVGLVSLQKLLSDMPPEICLSMFIAGLLTLFDLDDIFYVPKSVSGFSWMDTWSRLNLFFWWWGFVAVNAILAGALYLILRKDQIKDFHPLLAAAGTGFGYLALVRVKFTTIQDVPIGFELFYERAKNFAYKRINRITTHARQVELTTMAAKSPLKN